MAKVLVKLTFAILLPVIVGKLLQCIPVVPKAVKKVKRWISIVTSTCLALMLWMKVRGREREGRRETKYHWNVSIKFT